MDERDDLQAMLDVIATVSAGTPTRRDQLLTLQCAWLTIAECERSEALAFPGGFPAAQTEQLEQLRKMGELVKGDPDLEAERLRQDDDTAGLLRHLRQQFHDAGLGEPSEGD